MNKVKIAKQILKIAKEITSGSWSNYPDDIHMYNNDPRSPFYVDDEIYPILEIETDLEQVEIKVPSILKNGTIFARLDWEKYKFSISTDLVDFEFDYGILNNPSHLKKGDLMIYYENDENGEWQEVDYLDLNHEQQNDLIKVLKKYLEDKDYTDEYELAREEYKKHQLDDYDPPDEDYYYDPLSGRYY